MIIIKNNFQNEESTNSTNAAIEKKRGKRDICFNTIENEQIEKNG